eukprot:GEMP01038811.1.p1 GENE.GEMP01038811.1~~GEMP01038811.1.p1  ORF type:complete len:396 (+),score=78.29 GEMP01038811.1:400-1587(+)
MSVLFAVFFLWSASAHDTYLRGSKSTMLAKEGVDKALPVEEIDIQRALKTKWEGESSPGVQVEIFKRANEEVKKMLLDGASKEARYALLLEWYPDKIPFASVAQIKKFRGDRGHMDENTKEYADEGKGRNDIKLKLFKNRTPAEQKFLYSGADKMFKLDLCPAADPSVQSELVNPTHEEAPSEAAITETSSSQPRSYLGSMCSLVPTVVGWGLSNMKRRVSAILGLNETQKKIKRLIFEEVHHYVGHLECEVPADELFISFMKALAYYVNELAIRVEHKVSEEEMMRVLTEPEKFDLNHRFILQMMTDGRTGLAPIFDFTLYVVLGDYIHHGAKEDYEWFKKYVNATKKPPRKKGICFDKNDGTEQEIVELDGVIWKNVRWVIAYLVPHVAAAAA